MKELQIPTINKL